MLSVKFWVEPGFTCPWDTNADLLAGAMQQKPICSALMNDHKALTEASKYRRDKFDSSDSDPRWLSYPSSKRLSLLKTLTVGGRRLGGFSCGGGVRVKGRWVKGGLNQLEERKLCHIQEEVWLRARTFLEADSALHRKRQMLTAEL